MQDDHDDIEDLLDVVFDLDFVQPNDTKVVGASPLITEGGALPSCAVVTDLDDQTGLFAIKVRDEHPQVVLMGELKAVELSLLEATPEEVHRSQWLRVLLLHSPRVFEEFRGRSVCFTTRLMRCSVNRV